MLLLKYLKNTVVRVNKKDTLETWNRVFFETQLMLANIETNRMLELKSKRRSPSTNRQQIQ